MHGRVCGGALVRSSALGRLSPPPHAVLLQRYRTAAFVWHSHRLLLSPSAEDFSEKKKLSLVCSPEILPCFFFAAPLAFLCSNQASLGFRQVPRLPPAKWSPSVLLPLAVSSLQGVWYPIPKTPPPWDAGTGWWGCASEHRRVPGELSTAEPELSALPHLDGQVCFATPVPPRPAPGFRCVCLGKLPAPC